ncbi:hypothetical protein THOG11_70142 [Vibrio harveyi]|nr:hypothetical protein TH15OA1_460141 [Vibrio harveyi]CAH1577567.1 hypothetical protein THOD03_60141 [Vibrio harveyi]CAH1586655.1 hypothetical protein THOG11_70142 [Vibrio harveyi]
MSDIQILIEQSGDYGESNSKNGKSGFFNFADIIWKIGVGRAIAVLPCASRK